MYKTNKKSKVRCLNALWRGGSGIQQTFMPNFCNNQNRLLKYIHTHGWIQISSFIYIDFSSDGIMS